MKDYRMNLFLEFFDPPSKSQPWFGGPRAIGIIRGITAEQAHKKFDSKRNSIWEISLHIAYWKYVVRRNMTGEKKGRFPRTPSNWPKQPDTPDEKIWKEDRTIIRKEHKLFVEALKNFDNKRLDEKLPGDSKYTFAELLFGVIEHDVYHTGQISILKKLSKK